MPVPEAEIEDPIAGPHDLADRRLEGTEPRLVGEVPAMFVEN